MRSTLARTFSRSPGKPSSAPQISSTSRAMQTSRAKSYTRRILSLSARSRVRSRRGVAADDVLIFDYLCGLCARSPSERRGTVDGGE
ncbi:hypothetical protein FB451DRAFT_1393910 [Mycena latifolia]|nr:hypothetical protein FB451DRAFT_1393910 [Mycena latifolia]